MWLLRGKEEIFGMKNRCEILLLILLILATLVFSGCSSNNDSSGESSGRPVLDEFDNKIISVLYNLCYYSDEVDGTDFYDSDLPPDPLLTFSEMNDYFSQLDTKRFPDNRKDLLSVVVDEVHSAAESDDLIGKDDQLRLDLKMEEILQAYWDYFDGNLIVVEIPRLNPSYVLDQTEIASAQTQQPDKDDPAETAQTIPDSDQTIPDSRWDGKQASGAMNGYSIIFCNEKAYFGTTYEDDDTIISSGQATTYTIEGGKIIFKAVGDPRTAIMSYDGTKITESVKKSETVFQPGYVFTKSYDLP